MALNVSHTVHPEASTSLMFTTEPEHVNRFCDSITHDRFAPTKHNSLCGHRSVSEVIRSHQDFEDRWVHSGMWSDVVLKLAVAERWEVAKRPIPRNHSVCLTEGGVCISLNITYEICVTWWWLAVNLVFPKLNEPSCKL